MCSLLYNYTYMLNKYSVHINARHKTLLILLYQKRTVFIAFVLSTSTADKQLLTLVLGFTADLCQQLTHTGLT